MNRKEAVGMKTKIVTEPTGNVVSLDEAIKHLNGVPSEDYGYVPAGFNGWAKST